MILNEFDRKGIKMFSLKEGDIMPGVGIGVIRLGMNLKQLEEIVGGEYNVDDREDYTVLVCDDVWIWVNKERDAATQILVCDGFAGKYAGCIGIGSTLSDVKRMLNVDWHDELDVFVLNDAPGMCFELDEMDEYEEWDELIAPITMISVFSR